MFLYWFYVIFFFYFLQTFSFIVNLKNGSEESLLTSFDQINENNDVSNEINFESNITITNAYRIVRNLTIK